mgnify:CR=1 FL=1
MPPSPKKSTNLRKRHAVKSKSVSLRTRLNSVAELLEFEYEEEFTGILPFVIHFLFSLVGGIFCQQMFSSNPEINGKCVSDTSLSFENGVAGGSIVAYIYLSVSHEVTVSTIMYIIQNINSILIEIFKTYGVITFAFFMQRGILIPFISSENDLRLIITLPLVCSISGQINYITEKVWDGAENTNNNKGGNKQKKLGRKHLTVQQDIKTRFSTCKEEVYACCTKVIGQGFFEVLCIDNVKRLCIARKKFKGRSKRDNLISIGTKLLIGLRSYETKKKTN